MAGGEPGVDLDGVLELEPGLYVIALLEELFAPFEKPGFFFLWPPAGEKRDRKKRDCRGSDQPFSHGKLFCIGKVFKNFGPITKKKA
jgi:hypothetical protein